MSASPSATPSDDNAWLLKLHNCTNQGLFLSTLTLTLNANILAETPTPTGGLLYLARPTSGALD
ncbi:hypothetical protein HD554DRAFT_2170325 [Boletus coccyginus]|nr:hypothetical protein HD554DRAFT_2170325 [Boletus coccyginus]